MLKKFVIGAATLAVLGSTVVLAQQARERPDSPPPPAFSREDANAYLEARIAALHSGLQLTPDQEKLWPAFEQAYRERAKLRMERTTAGNAVPRTDDPVERLQRRADGMIRQGTVLKALADAAAPLWGSFDEGQKRRFAVLSRQGAATAGFGGGRPDEHAALGGPPARDGNRDGFGQGPGGFGPGGPGRRGGDEYGEGRGRPGPDGARGGEFGRGMGRGGPPGRDGERFGSSRDGSGGDGAGREGRAPRGMGPGGQQGRDRETTPDREQRSMMPRRPDRDYGRDFHRDFGDQDYGRGQFRWWHRDGGPGRSGWREGREPGNDDFHSAVPGEFGGRGERFSSGSGEERL